MTSITQSELIPRINGTIYRQYAIQHIHLLSTSHLAEDLGLGKLEVARVFAQLEKIFEAPRTPSGVIFTVKYLGELYNYWETYYMTGDTQAWTMDIQEKLVGRIEEGDLGPRPQKWDPEAYLRSIELPKSELAEKYPDPSTALLFSGQGAQYVGMANMIVMVNADAWMLFKEAKEILGYDLLDLCRNGPKEKLNMTEFAQPAIFCANIAALEKMKREQPGVLPSVTAVAGLSLGEYSALVCAKAISFQDALKVVKIRGEEMQKAAKQTQTGMLAILGLKKDEVETLVVQTRENGSTEIFVANDLCPGNIVVAGTTDALEAIGSLAMQTGAKKVTRGEAISRPQAVRLGVSGAFHTHFMNAAASKLNEALESIEIKQPTIPVIDNVTGLPMTNPSEIRQALVTQLTSAVEWNRSMNNMLDSGVERFFEVGIGSVLSGLAKQTIRGRKEKKAINIEQCTV